MSCFLIVRKLSNELWQTTQAPTFALIPVTTACPRGKASQGGSGLEAEETPQRARLVLSALVGVSVAGLGDASTCIKPLVCPSCGSVRHNSPSPASFSQSRLCLDQGWLLLNNYILLTTEHLQGSEVNCPYTDICIRGTHLGWTLGPVSVTLTQIIAP